MKNKNENIRYKSLFHNLYEKLPKNSFINKIRHFLLGFLSPFYFSYYHNHFKTCLRGIALNKNNDPIPWFTYPLIEILQNINWEGKKILEFGAGCSTIFFVKKNCEIISFEEDKNWSDFVINKSNSEKLKVINRPVGFNEELNEVKNMKFDVIIIDGHERQEILKIVTEMDLLSRTGAIIFDNSEGYEFSQIIESDEMFQQFSKVDFYGHTPGSFRKQSSTVIFKSAEKCFLFERKIKLKSSEELCAPL